MKVEEDAPAAADPPKSENLPEAPPPVIEECRRSMREQIDVMSLSQLGLFVLAAGYTVYLVRPVLLPIILALLLTLIFKPVQRPLQKFLRLPAPIAALLIMIAALAIGVLGIVFLSEPAATYAEKLRGAEVSERFSKMVAPLTKVKREITRVAEKVQKLTEKEADPASQEDKIEIIQGNEADASKLSVSVDRAGAGTDGSTGGRIGVDVDSSQGDLPSKSEIGSLDATSPDVNVAVDPSENAIKVKTEPPPVKVEITSSADPATPVYTFASKFAFDFLAVLGLLFFFLAYGDVMIKRMAEVDSAASLMEELTHDVSHYLFSITVINLALGIAVGIAMWILSMPNPALWGAMAALLNYIPYLGAMAGTLIVFVVATVSFDLTRQVIPVPIAYYLLTTIEGNFITPAVIGGKFTINPIIIFAWVFCWGVLWGVPGMLIGLPLLMVFRIVCAKLPSLARLERVISI